MISRNRQLLKDLFQTKGIDLKYGTFLDEAPGSMPEDFDFQRVEGMMLGLAIGDALGNTTEGIRGQTSLVHFLSPPTPPSALLPI